MLFRANPGPFHWSNRRAGRSGSFKPEGRIQTHGRAYDRNPRGWESEETWSARLFVGFNVEGVPTWDVKSLVDLVRKIRTKQVDDPSSTFLSQRGIYKSKKSGGVVEEDGAQVIIINAPPYDVPKDQFIMHMEELAEEIATQLQQEEVIVEVQKNGIAQVTFGWSPTPLT